MRPFWHFVARRRALRRDARRAAAAVARRAGCPHAAPRPACRRRSPTPIAWKSTRAKVRATTAAPGAPG